MTNTTTDIVIAEAYDADEQLNQLTVYLQDGGIATPEQLGTWQNEMGEKLGAIWAEAEAQQNADLANYASSAWETAQALVTQAHTTLSVTTAAVLAAKTMREQRDVAVDERVALEDAVRNQDTDHPLVSELVENVAQDVWENESETMWEDAMEQATDEADSDLVSHLSRLCSVSRDDVSLFLNEMYESEYADTYLHTLYPSITAEHRQQFGALIASVAATAIEVAPLRAAERQRRRDEQHAQSEAARVAQQQARYDTYSDLDDDGYPE